MGQLGVHIIFNVAAIRQAFTYIVSNPYNNPVGITIPFHRCSSGGSEDSSNVPQITQRASGRAKTQTLAHLVPSLHS